MESGLAAAGVGGAAAPAAAAKGGLGALMGGIDGGKLLQYGALASMMMPQGGGGGGGGDDEDEGDVDAKHHSRGEQAEAPDRGSQGGVSGEFNYFPDRKYYAEGGLASLAPDKSSGGSEGDEQLIDATISAIQGQTPNAEAIINTFVEQFGPEALQHLVQQVRGSMENSDGLSDSVPAQIQGAGGLTAPAQLSEGEYVVPSDVVSHLGNGSTQAGEKQLSGMVQRTRQARGAEAPKQIDPTKVLPA
jgi:hypothetical protein